MVKLSTITGECPKGANSERLPTFTNFDHSPLRIWTLVRQIDEVHCNLNKFVVPPELGLQSGTLVISCILVHMYIPITIQRPNSFAWKKNRMLFQRFDVYSPQNISEEVENSTAIKSLFTRIFFASTSVFLFCSITTNLLQKRVGAVPQ